MTIQTDALSEEQQLIIEMLTCNLKRFTDDKEMPRAARDFADETLKCIKGAEPRNADQHLWRLTYVDWKWCEASATPVQQRRRRYAEGFTSDRRKFQRAFDLKNT